MGLSEREKLIVKVIGNKKLTVKEIAEAVFYNKSSLVFDREISVTNAIRRIIKKCEHYKHDWTLVREKSGNHYIIYKGKV
jgi:hypothetical protein